MWKAHAWNANREFLDNLDEVVEDDAVWANKFLRDYHKKIKDPHDIYLEIKDSEERRRKKGLPRRLVILPGWDMSDEERYDEEQAQGESGSRTRLRKQRRNINRAIQNHHYVQQTAHKHRYHADAGKGYDQWRNVKHPRGERRDRVLRGGGIPASKAMLRITSVIPLTTERSASMFVSTTTSSDFSSTKTATNFVLAVSVAIPASRYVSFESIFF